MFHSVRKGESDSVIHLFIEKLILLDPFLNCKVAELIRLFYVVGLTTGDKATLILSPTIQAYVEARTLESK